MYHQTNLSKEMNSKEADDPSLYSSHSSDLSEEVIFSEADDLHLYLYLYLYHSSALSKEMKSYESDDPGLVTASPDPSPHQTDLLQNVFVQIAKYICFNCKMYLPKTQNIFFKRILFL